MLDCTDITVILDRSGSMSAVKDAMEEVLNGYLYQQKQVPGACTFSLIQFDDKYDRIINGVELKDVPQTIVLLPRGNTALLDAVGRAINETGLRLSSLPESRRPSKVMIVIVTDGLENASHEFTRDRVFQMISHQREKYNWEFVFLGANQDAVASAADLGISSSNALNYANTRGAVKGVGMRLSSATRSYRQASGQTCSASFGAELTGGGIMTHVTDEDAKKWDEAQKQADKDAKKTSDDKKSV